jgi:hypothetical protein
MVWPVIRLTYSTYIGIAGPEDDAVLDVPQEADTAIFMRAAEIFVARLKGPTASVPMKPETLDARLALEQQYRDWEDS